MTLEFETITRAQAVDYTEWTYESPYDFYNFPESERHVEVAGMLDGASKTFAVVSEGEFIAVLSFGEDGQVRGGCYDDRYQDTGIALRPNLTGKGHGENVLRAGLLFGAEQFGFTRFRVTVAAFNQRALHVYNRIGFKEQQRFLVSPTKASSLS